MIQLLRLSDSCSRASIRTSKYYIKLQWRDTPELLYGIGKYGSDDYRIIICVIPFLFEKIYGEIDKAA